MGDKAISKFKCRDLSHFVKNNSSSSYLKNDAVAIRIVADAYSKAKEIKPSAKDYYLSTLTQRVLSKDNGRNSIGVPRTDLPIVRKVF